MNGFSNEVLKQYDKLMSTSEWIDLTLQQLLKDFVMAGLKIESTPQVKNRSEMLAVLVEIISVAKSKKEIWDNLNYRIDIPEEIDISALSMEEVAELYLKRSFQKVWLRRHFAS